MPGLVGAFGASDHATVADMQRVLAHRAATICGPRAGGGNLTSPDGPRHGDDVAPTLPAVHIAGHVSNRRALAQLLADHGRPAGDGAVETVLARLFAAMGPSCLRHVQGHFALVVRSATQMVLMRDRFGTVPLHYVVAPDRSCLLVASEANALVGRLGVSPTIDLERLADVLVFGDVLGDGTLLRHIKKVRPGTAVLASLADGRVEIHVESVPPVARPVHLPLDDETVLDAIGRTIAGGVTACADGAGHVGVALSGGLDSSVVTLFAAERLGRDALTTFTLSSPSATEDLHAARELAGTLGVQHANIPITFDAYHHIPFSNPYVTKLASMATAAIRQHECDAIFAYYLQPYGLAAHLAGHWTDTPYAIRHAGSDVGRLMKDVQLRTAYQEVFRRAGCVVTGADPETFVAMGVDRDRIWASRGFPLPDIFTADAVPIDLNGRVRDMVADEARDDVPALTNSAHIDPSIPTVGICGKVGAVKGSFDLLHALARLKTEGVRFNFVAVTQGRALGRFTALVRELGLEDRTWILPFLPHWRIPGFIRACTCVCFLERDFPVAIHGPTVPREVLACGTCLVVSREIATRQHFRGEVRDGEHFVTIDTPRHHANLAARLADVIHDPDRAAAMGAAGHALYRESLEPNEWDALLADFPTASTFRSAPTPRWTTTISAACARCWTRSMHRGTRTICASPGSKGSISVNWARCSSPTTSSTSSLVTRRASRQCVSGRFCSRTSPTTSWFPGAD